MRRAERSPRGFTLIELLVVIAIIAILAAILFPVFAQARDKARSATCLSNAKQQALAFHMYAQDYDEITVPAYYGEWYAQPMPKGHYNWAKLLVPYVKNKAVYTCPALPNGNWDRSANIYGKGVEYEFPSLIGYGINTYFAPAPVAKSDRPAETFAIVETRYYPPGHPGYAAYPDTGWYTTTTSSDIAWTDSSGKKWTWSQLLTADRHQNGQNVCFLDGHAKYLRFEKVAVGPKNENLPNYTGQGL